MVSEIRRCTMNPQRVVVLALAGLLWTGAGVAGAAPPPAAGNGAACADGPTRLCLAGRYEVQATWQDEQGRERAAVARPLAGSATGAFSFSGGETVDLLVRVGGGAGVLDIQAAGLTGAAYALQVVDRTTGARFERSATAEPGNALPAVEHALEAGDRSASFAAAATAARGACDSPQAHCFLGGRFEVKVTRVEANGRTARTWAVAGAGATGLFASRSGGEPDVAVRLIDSREATGHVGLLYGALLEGELAIELIDRATGNSRRFVKPAGAPASGFELEALSAAAAVVHATLDTARAVTAHLGPAGGTLEAVDAQGTRFRLVVPAKAMISQQEVTLTPVATLGGLPFSGALAGAVYVEPSGLILNESAALTVTPSPALERARQLTFSFRGLAGELALAPPVAGSAALVLRVHRFGGYGLGAGTAADLSAQLLRVPSRSEDRLLQKLAGLILPLRRAGSTAKVLPASVLQVLQQDYTATIKASVLKLKQGSLEANYPVVRNWQNAVKDTGQSAKVQTQLQEIQGAEIAGAVVSYNAAVSNAAEASALVANAVGAAAASRPCKSLAAARQLYRAYALLRARGRESLVVESKLTACARFDLKWNTLLDWRPPGGLTIHQDVEAGTSVGLDQNGYSVFLGIRTTRVNEERVTQPVCNAFFSLEKIGTRTASVALFELEIPGFSWSDELLTALRPSLYYQFEPRANQDWRVTCTQSYPPAPPLGPISAEYSVSWSGNYTFFHIPELERRGYRARLGPSASPSVFAEKVYNNGSEIAYFEEHTLITVVFAPR